MNKSGASPQTVYLGTMQHAGWTLHLAATEHGLCTVTLPNENHETLVQWVQKHIVNPVMCESQATLAPYIAELQEYLSGTRTSFSCSLDLRGTPFQLLVWEALRSIPYGELRSYSEIARQIGRNRAVRAVGTANGANPIPFIVPCHRVIGQNGRLVGYRGGVDVKQQLLRLEGAAIGNKVL